MGLLADYSIASLNTCLQVCELCKERRNMSNQHLENNSYIVKRAAECWRKFNAANMPRKKHKINSKTWLSRLYLCSECSFLYLSNKLLAKYKFSRFRAKLQWQLCSEFFITCRQNLRLYFNKSIYFPSERKMFGKSLPFLIPLVTWQIHSIISFPDKDPSLTLSLEWFWDQTPPKKDAQ